MQEILLRKKDVMFAVYSYMVITLVAGIFMGIAINTHGGDKMTDWEKIESDVVQWENEGDTVEGVLVAVELGQFDNRVYTIETEQGDKTVFGTTVLDSLMGRVEKGDKVKIVFQGLKESEKKGHQAMKLFDVFVKKP